MPGGVITTASHPKTLWPGVKLFWGEVYEGLGEAWRDLADQETSEMAYEETVQNVGMGLAQVKAQGQSVAYDSDFQGYVTRFVHQVFALGYIVTYEEILNNLYEKVSRDRARSNAQAMQETKNINVANMYNRAFNASYVGGDGVSLCNTAHPKRSGGTFNNKPTTDADLSEASLEDAIIDIYGFTNDRGFQAAIMPEQLLVSRQDWFTAVRILKSIQQSGTANNDINAIKATNALPGGVKMSRYFTSAHAWFIRTNIRGAQGLVVFQRQDITFDKDNDFDTFNAKALAYEYYSYGWSDPRAIYGVNGP